jgi:N-acetyl-anhydromuramoyl-L-alanine amidase
MIDRGWLAQARHIPSPNFDARPADASIDLLVVHNISLPPHQFGTAYAIDLFCNRLDLDAHPFFAAWLRNVRVSAHLYIRRDGELIQFVSLDDRAWHAGQSEWQGRNRCNDFSIGVELEGSDLMPFRDVQYTVLASVVRELRAHYPIAEVVGHSDIAPRRKTDPGPFFDWDRLRTLLDR